MRPAKSFIVGLFLALGISSNAFAQCTGQPAAGRLCGNNTASAGLPGWQTMSSMVDRNFGAPSAQGTILNRGASLWSATATPSLGLNGTAGGAIILNGSSTGSATIGVRAAAGSTTFNIPVGNGTPNQVLITDGSGNTSWTTAGAGTVSSVGLSVPAIFTVTNSPVTGVGTLTATLATESANLVWAGPTTGAASAPTFRSIVGADLPNPSSSSLGGVQSFAAVGSQWIRQISTTGVPTASQPAFTDISGTLAPTQCPNPSASTLGCTQSFALQASKWISSISTSGVPSATQPSFTDIAGVISPGQLPSIGNNSILANNSGGTSIPSPLTASQVLDMIASTQGDVLYRNATGWVALAPGTNGQVFTTAGAAANPTWTTVTGTGTVTSLATNNGITGGTITTTGTIGLATIATGNVLAYTGAGSGVPVATTPSVVLDVIGATQGDILYRGASTWQVLSPGTNGQVLTQGASTPAWGSAGSVSTVSTSGILTGGPITTTGTIAVNAALHPQGRITLTSATPVMTVTTAAQTTVFYTPDVGNLVPIYDGTNMVPTAFAEVSQATTDATKSPAAVAASSVYDIFCWVDTGPTNRCTRGPAWTNDTTRGAGTALTRVNGIWLNNASITNGPAASRGTYVGTIRSNSSSQIDYIFGGVGASGTAGFLGVWNAYNRVDVATFVGDSTDTWTYGTASWRAANNSITMRTTFVVGLAEDAMYAQYNASGTAPSTGDPIAGVGLDTTGGYCGASAFGPTANANFAIVATCQSIPAIGVHFVSANEYQFAGGTTTWQGDDGNPSVIQSGLDFRWRN